MSKNDRNKQIKLYSSLFSGVRFEDLGKAMGDTQCLMAVHHNSAAEAKGLIENEHLGTLYTMSPMDLAELVSIQVNAAILITLAQTEG